MSPRLLSMRWMKGLRSAGTLWVSAVRLVEVWRVIRLDGFHPAWQRFACCDVLHQCRAREIDELVWAVNVLATRLGYRCLPRSLALCSLLRERDLEAEVKIGVRREGGTLLAHAWVELRGNVLGEHLHPDWQTLPLAAAASLYEKAAAPTS